MTAARSFAFERVAGVDEAGRGPLAGPVVAAAVILHPRRPIAGLRDSKKLSARQRENLAPLIRQRAVAYAFGRAEVDEIDTLNILQATLQAMRRAVLLLAPPPRRVLVDGNRAPRLDYPVTTIIGGDDIEPCIAAASILAKTRRDRDMLELHAAHPEYGFDAHKGYPTRQHIRALRAHGASRHHRRSFRPVREALQSAMSSTLSST